MKLKLKIFLILLGLVMIVLPATSQIAYQRNDTTYTCYTSEENRIISVLLIEGERDAKLLDIANNHIKLLEAKQSVIETKQTLNNLLIKDIVARNDALVKSNKKANRAVKFYKTTTIIGSGIAIILALIVLI